MLSQQLLEVDTSLGCILQGIVGHHYLPLSMPLMLDEFNSSVNRMLDPSFLLPS